MFAFIFFDDNRDELAARQDFIFLFTG